VISKGVGFSWRGGGLGIRKEAPIRTSEVGGEARLTLVELEAIPMGDAVPKMPYELEVRSFVEPSGVT